MHNSTLLWWYCQNTVGITCSGIQIHANSCLRSLYCNWTSGRDETRFVSWLTFALHIPFSEAQVCIPVWLCKKLKPHTSDWPRCTCSLGNSCLLPKSTKSSWVFLSEALMGSFSSAQLLIFTKPVGADIYKTSPLLNWQELVCGFGIIGIGSGRLRSFLPHFCRKLNWRLFLPKCLRGFFASPWLLTNWKAFHCSHEIQRQPATAFKLS